MEQLHYRTCELKDTLLKIKDHKSKEEIIFEHIDKTEQNKSVVDDFPSELDWFNTSKPLKRSLLKGKIVVLDFFTYCCINCLHIIPHLRELEENFSVTDGLVVIGVHSAKFDNEKISENILQALKKFKISHPVVNDKACFLWNRLNLSCWPTLVILGPKWQPIFVLVGEGHRDELLLFVKTALKYYKGSISQHMLPYLETNEMVSSKLLCFPGKIARWENTLAISDSGNHRILLCDSNGNIILKIGGQTPGFRDGLFETALFNSPQGLAFYNAKIIYIADTENHAIRLANLETLKVTTVVGTGIQGKDLVGGKIGAVQEISSPWDVCIVPCSDVEVQKHFSTDIVSFSDVKSLSSTNLLLSVQPLSSNSISLPPPLPSSSSSSSSLPSSSPLLSTSSHPPPPPPLPPPSAPSKFFESECVSCSINEQTSNNTNSSKVLLIATAGSHQIWAYFIDSGVWWMGNKNSCRRYEKNICLAIAGNGKEENRNNNYPTMASFAQPSGLCYSPDLKAVFIADSESSTIRKISLKDGIVSHVVGGSKSPDDLFSFGDSDGISFDAKLQHPLGVAWNSKKKLLYVCDTYNHKIKEIDVIKGICKTVCPDSKWLSEPSGCCLNDSENMLFICDTNNNCIKMLDLSTNDVNIFELKQEHIKSEQSTKDHCEIWQVETTLSVEKSSLTLIVEFLPQGIHGKWKLLTKDSHIKTNNLYGDIKTNTVKLTFEVLPSKKNQKFQVSFDLILCGSETCNFKKNVLHILVKRERNAGKTACCKVKKNFE